MINLLKKSWEDKSSRVILILAATLFVSSILILGNRVVWGLEIKGKITKYNRLQQSAKKNKCKEKREQKKYYQAKRDNRQLTIDRNNRLIEVDYLSKLASDKLEWVPVLSEFLGADKQSKINTRLSLYSEGRLHMILEGSSEADILQKLEQVTNQFQELKFRIDHVSVSSKESINEESKVAMVVSVETLEVSCEE